MTDSGHFEEPLQRLPAGMPRGYAEYKPAAASPGPPPTNVGGYDELLSFFHSRTGALPRSEDGLAAIDHLIDSPGERASLAKMVWPIGMFYGDVLTHTIPGAHWEVIVESSPCVRVTRKVAVSVVAVAKRRLTMGVPTLLQNYVHVLEMVARET